MTEKRVSVRLAAVGGKQVRAELEGVGDAGDDGFGRMSKEADIPTQSWRSFFEPADIAGNVRHGKPAHQISPVAFGAVAFEPVAFGAVAFEPVAFGAVAFEPVAFGAVAFEPVAFGAVKRIDAVFNIERDINGLAPNAHLGARSRLSAPLLTGLAVWLRSEPARMSKHNPVAKAIDPRDIGAGGHACETVRKLTRRQFRTKACG